MLGVSVLQSPMLELARFCLGGSACLFTAMQYHTLLVLRMTLQSSSVDGEDGSIWMLAFQARVAFLAWISVEDFTHVESSRQIQDCIPKPLRTVYNACIESREPEAQQD